MRIISIEFDEFSSWALNKLNDNFICQFELEYSEGRHLGMGGMLPHKHPMENVSDGVKIVTFPIEGIPIEIPESSREPASAIHSTIPNFYDTQNANHLLTNDEIVWRELGYQLRPHLLEFDTDDNPYDYHHRQQNDITKPTPIHLFWQIFGQRPSSARKSFQLIVRPRRSKFQIESSNKLTSDYNF